MIDWKFWEIKEDFLSGCMGKVTSKCSEGKRAQIKEFHRRCSIRGRNYFANGKWLTYRKSWLTTYDTAVYRPDLSYPHTMSTGSHRSPDRPGSRTVLLNGWSFFCPCPKSCKNVNWAREGSYEGSYGFFHSNTVVALLYFDNMWYL